MISDCTLEAFKLIGTGPLVNMEGEKVGGIYPALKVYSDRSVMSQSQVQSSSLLAGHLESTVNNSAPSKSQQCSEEQVPGSLNGQYYFLQALPTS